VASWAPDESVEFGLDFFAQDRAAVERGIPIVELECPECFDIPCSCEKEG